MAEVVKKSIVERWALVPFDVGLEWFRIADSEGTEEAYARLGALCDNERVRHQEAYGTKEARFIPGYQIGAGFERTSKAKAGEALVGPAEAISTIQVGGKELLRVDAGYRIRCVVPSGSSSWSSTSHMLFESGIDITDYGRALIIIGLLYSDEYVRTTYVADIIEGSHVVTKNGSRYDLGDPFMGLD